MHFLLFSITSKELIVTKNDLFKNKLEKKRFSVDISDLETTLNHVIKAIQINFTSFEGGIFQDVPADFYTSNKKVTTLNYSLESLIKLFSEGLNCPILTTTEAQQTSDLAAAFTQKTSEITWNLDYFGYTPGKEEYSIESLLTIGNGFMGLRGTLPEMEISTDTYPATYIAGLYNTAESTIAEQTVANEDFVNTPNSQYISLKVEGAKDWLHIEAAAIQKLHRRLNLKTGLFSSEMVIRDEQGNCVKLRAHKIVNMNKMNNYSIQYIVEPLNFSKNIMLKTAIDGAIFNFNVERYRNLTQTHFHITNKQTNKDFSSLEVMTNDSKISVRQTARIQGDFFTKEQIDTHVFEEKIEQVITFFAEQNQQYHFEKHVQVQASIAEKSWHTPSPLAHSFAAELAESQAAWQELWSSADIVVTGDMMSQKLLRLHTYHLFVSASPFNNQELDVSITARGLHGEAYRGHIFWDEIFILPFYIMHFPETAKQLLMYRYNRLGKAKQNALESDYEGAMYPWQSGRDGREDTQKLHLNPLNGEWGEDHSILQRHVSLAIAYNVWLYWNSTNDETFIKTYGAEMLLEIANFWRSAATYDDTSQRYFIDKVMGPDEFHEAYPNSTESGLKNNAYTNLMVVWLFEEIETILSLLNTQEKTNLMLKTGITLEKINEMKKIRQGLTVEVNEEGIIAQYEGYFNLKEIDWNATKVKYGNIYRMDRILKAEGKSPDDYKVSKQADTLMLFYNLNKERIDVLLKDLGYTLPTDYLEKNLMYYLARTSHGSTLSRIVHAQLAEAVKSHELSWKLYQEALYSDYRDIQGGTTAEGIHTGVMAATIYVTLTTYAGIDIKEEQLTIKPNLPKKWSTMFFNLEHKGVHYQLTITKNNLKIVASNDIRVIIKEQVYELKAQNQTVINY